MFFLFSFSFLPLEQQENVLTFSHVDPGAKPRMTNRRNAMKAFTLSSVSSRGEAPHNLQEYRQTTVD